MALVVCFLAATPAFAQTFRYTNALLKDVIVDIQSRGGYRFLYRDALIVEKRLTFHAESDELIAALGEALAPLRIGVQYVPTHRQLLLFETNLRSGPSRPSVFSGVVVDAQTGARLPFASVTWRQDHRIRGVTTNEAGVFSMRIDEPLLAPPGLAVRVSYIGYQTLVLQLDQEAPHELAIRLVPEPIRSQEVVVSSSILQTDLDTTWHYLLGGGRFSALSESSVLRGLQPLPMVSISPAMSEGITIRGSKADGFQVLLDGASIYNQNHFFGFFDVFNPDALQTVGFYYDIAPATFFAPPGGTMSFSTRTGSLHRAHIDIGASNTAARFTAEGPLRVGRSSWLVSGRHSYIDAVHWLNNPRLVRIGLDVDRERSPLPDAYAGVENRLVTPGPAAARFYDVHAKAYFESASGRRHILAVYAGGNATRLDAQRLFGVRDTTTNVLRAVARPVETRNRWGNEAVSLQRHHPFGRRGHALIQWAGSHYRSSFGKDDFVFTRINTPSGQPRNFIFPFAYENELYDLQWAHTIRIAPVYSGQWSVGAAANYFALRYAEQSASRPRFEEDYYAIQADAFAQFEYTAWEPIDLSLGLRTHYFTQGQALKGSPRGQLVVFPRRAVSLKFGYSRNYQFLHHLSLQNTNSASVWIMTTGATKPASVDNATAGIYLKPRAPLSLQIEAYTRSHRNLRRHEINAPAALTTANDQRFVPWFSDNRAFARGVETTYRQTIGRVMWTNSYTLSRVDIQNERVNDGARFPAEWDRRHQFSSHLSLPIRNAVTFFATWYYATGTPNVLGYDDPSERRYLPDYHRLDAGVRVHFSVGKARIDAKGSVFNAYDRTNIWYRDPVQVYNADRPGLGFSFVNVDVYDLGIQPAFDLSLSW